MKKVFFILLGLSIGTISIVSAQIAASKDRLQQYVYTLAADSMKGRGINSPESRMAAEYIIKQFEMVGVKPFGGYYLHPFTFSEGPIRTFGNNIIGVVEGSDPLLKNEFILIGAHYDHLGYELKDGKPIVYNGADDNASGVATIIEMGQLLAMQKETLKRSVIIIAFDGEESGLKGSTQIVLDSIIPVKQVKLMVSVDMVGMLKANEYLNLKGSATLEDGNNIFEGLAAKHGITLKHLGPTVESRTDTNPFGAIGIPSIAPTTGTKSPYHEPEDDANLLDYEGMATISDFLTDMVVQLSGNETLIAASSFTNKVKHGGIPFFTSGVKIGLGTSKHNYPNQFYRAKPLFAAQAGVYGRLRLTHRIAIQPEVQYETNGSKISTGNMRFHSINIPFNLLYDCIKNNTFDNHIYLMLGGYYSYSFAGTIDGKKMDFDDQFNRIDYGINVGITMEIMGIQAGFVVKRGLPNILKHGEDGDQRNTEGFFTMGIRF